MSNRALMETVLHDLLVDMETLHAATKSERLKIRIEKYVERILQALETTMSPGEGPFFLPC